MTHHPIDLHETGTGEPLVLLHGVGGSWPIWTPVIPLLAKTHRVIAPTLPGHPGGVPLAGEPTIPALADALIAQLKARGIDSAHVVGNSLGGWLALELARRGFARSVTALSPAGGWRRAEDFDALSNNLLLRFRVMPLVYVLFWLFMIFAGARKALAKDTMEHGDRIPAADFRAMLRSFRDSRLMPALFRNTGSSGGFQPLDAGGVPVRVAWCERDRVLSFENYGAPFIERIVRVEHTTLAGVGHVPMYDDPAAVAETILSNVRRAAA